MSKNIKIPSMPKIRELTLIEIKNVSGGRVSLVSVGKNPNISYIYPGKKQNKPVLRS
ncbi:MULTISPECIES: hypothetical protein [Commensalibacter]|uniref:Bacteriocin n=1 Tax=Commensalibacter papalotli (ex Botero et al. 2024) TaxID=2972766 RepID=A0ABM9HLD3_9PROT|nr:MULTISPECIES: hypothetical protein [Commensalibacter]CAI3933434.1 unnamed protein product [Commensalibacter papalotli (ex Botero et al. 2024)]CAI3949460.1 unnamed protein product [Commensalibacter papalotli (ex Botero et al. 2024)]